jgi:NRAMP (natural resistance-associated macrophage protein)-like metal ion transporter
MKAITRRLHRAALLERLGPGVVTGAADDDPSGIATYSQAGAAYGLNLLWTLVLTFPLMAGFQSVCARIGRVTGQGLAANIKEVFPAPVVFLLVGLLFVANTINIGADLAAMGEAAGLVVGWSRHLHAVAFGAVSLLLQIFVPYHRYARVLKWLTLVLFAYVAVVMVVHVDWREVALRSFLPDIRLDKDVMVLIVAVFGTTISPYLFFWQSSQEVEEIADHPGEAPLLEHPGEAREELRRIRWDTLVGMAFSNLIGIAIMVATAVTLHTHGVTNIQTAAQAAQALRPVAGELAFALFALGIIGTGLLAVPILAGSTAYALAETQGWRAGLELKFRQASGFYGVIAASVVLGVALDFSPIDPIKALVWSAVINGVASAPIMVVTMLVASRRDKMGRFTASIGQRITGWTGAAVMAAAAVAMIVWS